MKKILFRIAIFVCLIILTNSKIKAEFSSWYPVTSLGSTYSDFADLGAIQYEDGSGAGSNVLPNTTKRNSFKFSINDIPYGSNISSVEIKIKAKKQYSEATTATIYGQVIYDDLTINLAATSSSHLYNINPTTSYQWYTFYVSDDGVNDYITQYFRTHIFDPSKITVVLSDQSGSGTNSNLFYIDVLSMRLYWSAYTATTAITSSTIDSINGVVKLNLNGDTATWSAQMTCEVGLWEDCSSNTAAGWQSETAVTKIILDERSKDATTSSDLGGYLYLGTYWGTNGSSLWNANAITVPYHHGFSCSYDAKTLCTTRHYECTDRGCYWTGTDINMDATDSDIATINQEGETAIYCGELGLTNVPEWMMCSLRNLAVELFKPNFQLTEQELTDIKEKLDYHAPFAYVNALTSLDFTNMTEQTSITIPFDWVVDPTHTVNADVTLTNELDPIFNLVKPLIQFALYATFVIYIFNFVKRFRI